MGYEPIVDCDYGPLHSKVNLEPDFFTGFDPEKREEIVAKEAEFYHEITKPYSVDEKIEKFYIVVKAMDGAEIKVKVYKSKESSTGKRPAWVFAHGGGFQTCSVETHDFVPAYVSANSGVMVFSVEYRLAPEYKFPTGLEDCYAVLKYVAAHADDFSVDPSRIAVGGDSSGGTFAAALTLMAKDRKEVKIDKQVLIYPVTDMAGAVEKGSARAYPMVGTEDGDKKGNWLMEIYAERGTDPRNPYISPLLADDFRDLPKMLLINAECDALLDDGLIYAKCLQDAGVKVKYHIYKGMPHAFILRTYEETFAALDQICDFLK
ncbi:alpha/beta hydrolase [Clostridiales bacterium COT073_COT-073]|nr:alpha/beta hydrolase [Clostridiales bacterium COT073_COT-073]